MFPGVLLSIIVISILMYVLNFQNNKNTFYVSAFFIIVSLYGITHFAVTESKSVFWGAILYINLTSLYLISGPMLYFYLRNTLSDRFIFKKKDLFHFLPAIIHLIGLIPYLTTSFQYKQLVLTRLYQNESDALSFQSNIFFTPTQNFFLRLGLLVGYLSYNLYSLYRYKKGNYKNTLLPKQKKKTTFSWLVLLNILILASVLSYFLFVMQITLNPEKLNSALNGFVLYSSAVFIGILIFSLLLYPDILYGFPQGQGNIANTSEIDEASEKNGLEKKDMFFENPNDEKYYAGLKRNIESYFENNNSFLSSDFNMSDIAKSIEVPEHHIKYCLSNFMNKTFPQLKMEHRMKWGADALTSKEYQNQTIDYIGSLAGYKSKSSFFKNFKDFHGITPQEYKTNERIKRQNTSKNI